MVARYGDGKRDYHQLFEERLERLAARVEEMSPEAETKPYVDYGPVLERAHAQRAGLGWIGKNTCLIDPDRGSCLLLGELLTTWTSPRTSPSRTTAAAPAGGASTPVPRTPSAPPESSTPAGASRT